MLNKLLKLPNSEINEMSSNNDLSLSIQTKSVSRKKICHSIGKEKNNNTSNANKTLTMKSKMNNPKSNLEYLTIDEIQPIVLMELLDDSLLIKSSNKSINTANEYFGVNKHIPKITEEPSKLEELLSDSKDTLSSNILPSSSSNLHHSCVDRKIKPKKSISFKKSLNVQKYSRLRKKHDKSSEESSVLNSKTNNLLEKRNETTDASIILNSETTVTTENPDASVKLVNYNGSKKVKLSSKINRDSKPPAKLNDLLMDMSPNLETDRMEVDIKSIITANEYFGVNKYIPKITDEPSKEELLSNSKDTLKSIVLPSSSSNLDHSCVDRKIKPKKSRNLKKSSNIQKYSSLKKKHDKSSEESSVLNSKTNNLSKKRNETTDASIILNSETTENPDASVKILNDSASKKIKLSSKINRDSKPPAKLNDLLMDTSPNLETDRMEVDIKNIITTNEYFGVNKHIPKITDEPSKLEELLSDSKDTLKSNVLSSSSSNIDHSCVDPKIKPKKSKNLKKSSNVQQYSSLRKKHDKNSEEPSVLNSKTSNLLEERNETADTSIILNSETTVTTENPNASVKILNDSASKKIKLRIKINRDSIPPAILNDLVMDTPPNIGTDLMEVDNKSSNTANEYFGVNKHIPKITDEPSKLEELLSDSKDTLKSNVLSSSSSNLDHSCVDRKIKPKKSRNFKKRSNIQKYSSLRKKHGKSSVEPSVINSKTNNLLKKINERDSNPPVILNDLVMDTSPNIEIDWMEVDSNQLEKINLLQKEVDLLDYVHQLRSALKITHANYEIAFETLQQLCDLDINAVMLIKNTDVVDTIIKVTKYIGNAKEWNVSEQEVLQHAEKARQIRQKAQEVYNMFKSLFTVPDGQTFREVYIKEVNNFLAKTKDKSGLQIINESILSNE